jgi:hypothetical protein
LSPLPFAQTLRHSIYQVIHTLAFFGTYPRLEASLPAKGHIDLFHHHNLKFEASMPAFQCHASPTLD